MPGDVTTYQRRRGTQMFRWDSYAGGEDYRYPRSSPLSGQTVRWTSITADGAQQTESRRYTSYLVPFRAEDDRSFELRLSVADYVNIVAPIVDAYARGVTSGVQRVLGELEQYASDVDLRGTSWGDMFEGFARWCTLYGECAIAVDAPRSDGDTRVDPRPYAIVVHPTQWAWTRTDEYGRVTEFAWVEQARYSEDGQMCHAHVRILRAGEWEVRKVSIHGGVEMDPSAGETVAKGPLPPALDGRVPVVFGYTRRDETSASPRGISIVGDACDLARKVYNRRSYADTIAAEAGFPTLAIPMASTGGQLDPGTRMEIGTSKGLGYNSTAGAPQWIQPSAEWFREMHNQNLADCKLAFRTTGIDSDSDAGAAASGEALRIRSRDFESMARTLARHMHACEMAVAELFAVYAGTTTDELAITYPSRFVLPDQGADFDRAVALLRGSPIELGVTAKRAAAMQMISSAIPLDDTASTAISNEVEAVLRQDEARAVAALTTGTDVQSTALNGAQSQSLLTTVESVAARKISRQSGVELIMVSTPTVSLESATRLIGPPDFVSAAPP